MARGDDLTKQLDTKELARLRAILAENPVEELPPGTLTRYPRMLYHESFVEAQLSWKEDPRPEIKKLAAEKMKVATVVVFDPDEEAEYLQDGWRRSPADFMKIDPRIPVGREARRAQIQTKQSRQAEITELKLRLAELMGQRPADDEKDGPEAPEPARVAAPRAARGPYKKRKAGRQTRAPRTAAIKADVPASPASTEP